MGRPKKPQMCEKRVRIPSDINDYLEAEISRNQKSFNENLVILLEKGLKKVKSKYQGFKEVLMSHPFTCFECQKQFSPGRLAMYDADTGAAMCLSCAIENEMTTKAAAKLIIQRLRLKRDIKSLKTERLNEAAQYEAEFLERALNLKRLALIEKTPLLEEESKKRQKQWDKYHSERYEVQGLTEKDAFREFIQHDLMLLDLLRKLRAEHEAIEREREKILLERIKKAQKKKAKVVTT